MWKVAALLLIPLSASATDYCEIAGLAYGAEKEFVGSVAAQLANRQDIYGSSTCNATMASAQKTGARLAAGGKRSEADNKAWSKLLDFEERVIDAVIDKMQLGE